MKLKLWTLNILTQFFICADTGKVEISPTEMKYSLMYKGCPGLGEFIPNSGENLYSCYKCEYDLCGKCVQRRLDKTVRLCGLCDTKVDIEEWRRGYHRCMFC